MTTLRDSASRHAHEAALAHVKAEKPSRLVVGGSFDGETVTGGVSYDIKWTNGWGATAYARAFWTRQAVVGTDRFGYVVGAEAVKTFND